MRRMPGSVGGRARALRCIATRRVAESTRPPTAGATAQKLGKSSTLHEKTEQRLAKAEALAVLDDDMLFLRGGIDALQDN